MLKDFLIKNNIDFREVISLYLFIQDTYSDITEFEINHGAYEAYPEYILNDLEKSEEKFEKYKILFKQEYPEANFEYEVYDLFCDEIENKVEDIKKIKKDMPQD